MADLRLGVVSIRPTASAARAAAAATMHAILEAATAAGVERRDLRTLSGRPSRRARTS